MSLHTGMRPLWEPSTDDIATACRAIQAGWSPEERARRSRFYSGGYELAGIRVCDTSELRKLGVNVGEH